jgi:hypothetical protein
VQIFLNTKKEKNKVLYKYVRGAIDPFVVNEYHDAKRVHSEYNFNFHHLASLSGIIKAPTVFFSKCLLFNKDAGILDVTFNN